MLYYFFFSFFLCSFPRSQSDSSSFNTSSPSKASTKVSSSGQRQPRSNLSTAELDLTSAFLQHHLASVVTSDSSSSSESSSSNSSSSLSSSVEDINLALDLQGQFGKKKKKKNKKQKPKLKSKVKSKSLDDDSQEATTTDSMIYKNICFTVKADQLAASRSTFKSA